ncbi:MAG TPA: hypothetical protein VF511_06085 [Chthoniobacterales bacterium]
MKRFPVLLVASAVCCSLIAAEEKDAAKPLPAPVSEKTYTFQQIDEQKATLDEKVVRVELARLLGKGSLEGDGLLHFIAKDTSGTTTPYGQVAFPKEGVEKTGLADPKAKPQIVYMQVHVFEDKKAAALSVAVGTQVSTADGKARYSW